MNIAIVDFPLAWQKNHIPFENACDSTPVSKSYLHSSCLPWSAVRTLARTCSSVSSPLVPGSQRTSHLSSTSPRQVMCYKETPYYGCGHYGKPKFVGGEPCIRATTQPGLSQGCWDVVDLGIASVNTLCSTCKPSFSSTSSLRTLSSTSFSGSEWSDDSSSLDGEQRGRCSAVSTNPSSVSSSRESSASGTEQRPVAHRLLSDTIQRAVYQSKMAAPANPIYGKSPKAKVSVLSSCMEL